MPSPAPATAEKPAAPAGPSLRERAKTRLATLGPAVRKRATPVRLAAAGTALVVAGTLWWAARGAGLEAARQTLADAPPAAATALERGRFEDAAARFTAEADALATLGRGDSVPAKLARQRAREATAAAGLASQTPLQIAAEAAAARTPTARTAWANAFDALHRGRWVVLDTLAAAVPPPEPAGPRRRDDGGDGEPVEPPPRVELLYPLAAGEVRARLVGDPAVPAGLSVTDPPRRVVLAARYGGCVRVADPAGRGAGLGGPAGTGFGVPLGDAGDAGGRRLRHVRIVRRRPAGRSRRPSRRAGPRRTGPARRRRRSARRRTGAGGRGVTAALLIALAAAFAPPPSGTLSTMDLLAAKGDWYDWRDDGVPLTVEGRVRYVAGGTLGLRGLPLAVRPAAGATLGRADDRTARVEVTGRLASGPGGLFLEATAVRVVSRDDAVFTDRKIRLDKSDPAAWEELAAWAEARAAFYDDPPLAARAAAARRAAFDLRWDAAGEADSLPPKTPPRACRRRCGRGWNCWIRRATAFDADLRRTRTHELLREWWDALRDDREAPLAPLAGAVRERLPGADRPAVGAPAFPETLAEYERNPVDAYRAAPAEARRALNRAFFVAVERERIERGAAPDGRDGFAVAARLTDRLPELADLAAGYRARELAWRRARVETATRAEAIELASLFAAEGDEEAAGEVRRRWLAAREKSLRSDGVNGLIRAAEESRAVLPDPAAGAAESARLLREAYAAAPPGTDAEANVAARLTALGLVRVGERWLAPDEADAAIDPTERAVRAGRVVVGMSGDQVRRALGEPPLKTTAATAAGVAEVWVYARPAAAFSPGGGGLAVHLLRSRGAPAGDAKVTAVHRL